MRLGVSLAQVGGLADPASIRVAAVSAEQLGRLTVGLGLGRWSDEYETAGVFRRDLGARLDEVLDGLGAVWGHDPASPGDHYRPIVRSRMGPEAVPQPDRVCPRAWRRPAASDVAATRRAGAHEVILGLHGNHCLNEALEHYAGIAESLDVATAA